MDIKENFYSKLQQIRESAEQLDEIGDTSKGKRAINFVAHRADDELANQAMKSRPNKKKVNKSLRAISLAANADERRGGKVLNSYLKRSYGLKEEEQLDEISYQKARKAEDKAAEVYHKDYDDETDARRKYMRDKTPESKKEAEEAGKKRKKSAKRVIRFQNYAEKKK